MPKGVYIRTKSVWNKDLTKETDKRLADMGAEISKSKKGVPFWSKGLTKETDERIHSSWCKGLTKEIDERLAETSKTQVGKKRSEETKANMKKPRSEKAKANMKGHCGVYKREPFSEKHKQNIGKGSKRKFVKMNKEERREYMFPALKAAQEANPSSIEKKIWEELDKLSITYNTQISFNHGKFIVDIYVPAQRVIIECNGDFWHSLQERKERDNELRKYAMNNEYKLIELSEHEIRRNPKLALGTGLRGVNFGF